MLLRAAQGPINRPISRYAPFLTLAILVLFLLSPAIADTGLSTTPLVQIETGMHTGKITAMSVDAAGRFLVTASMDKTVRVWNAKTGDAVETLSPPIGDGQEGRILTAVISPDGKTIACAGDTTEGDSHYQKGDDAHKFAASWSYFVYVFDRVSGRLIRRLPSDSADAPGYEIAQLAFTPDGKFIVAGEVEGFQYYSASDGALVGQASALDSDLVTLASGERDGTPIVAAVVTGSASTNLDLYSIDDAGAHKTASVDVGYRGLDPMGLAFSPDGSQIAIGSDLKQDVYSTADLSPVASPAPDSNATLYLDKRIVAWSPDGSKLYGRQQTAAGDKASIVYWQRTAYSANPHVLRQAAPSILAAGPNGLCYASDLGAIVAVDAAGKSVIAHTTQIVDFKAVKAFTDTFENGPTFDISDDGSQIQFYYGANLSSLAWISVVPKEMQATSMLGGPGAQGMPPPVTYHDARFMLGRNDPELAPPVTKADGIDVEGWDNGPALSATFNGKALDYNGFMEQGDRQELHCLAITADKQRFLVGSDAMLWCYSVDGSVKWSTPVTDDIWELNVSGDGKVAVAALGDGTIRWYRMSDGKELLSFFPDADRKRWIFWTPSGYYDCSAGGDGLIGWRVNGPKDHEGGFYPVSQFRDTFYRPEIVQRMIATLDEGEAVQQANAASGRTTQVDTDVTKLLPPVVQILSPDAGAQVSDSSITLRYAVRSVGILPVTSIKVLVDGRPADEQRDLQLVDTDPDADARTIDIKIPEHDCTVSVIAENANGASEPASVDLVWSGGETPAIRKPTLYVLAVGVGAYPDPIPQLKYPAKDAQDFVDAVSRQKGDLYGDVVSKVLVDGHATRKDVLEGLQWIEHQTTQYDVAMIYLSGHGVNDNQGAYYYAGYDLDTNDLLSTGVRFSDIRDTIDSLAGKTIVFIDTCHAGNALGTARLKGLDINGVVNELSSAENGAIVFASSTGRQLSEESDDWDNGAFTKALVEGIDGKAAVGGTGRITWESLSLYVSDRVKELTDGEQTPTTIPPSTVPDFPIAVTGDHS